MAQTKGRRYYFDWAATAMPWDDSGKMESIPKGQSCSTMYGNPSSPHAEGRKAKEALENARSRCAAILGVLPETLYFTSGGTESNSLVLYSFLKRKGKGPLLYSEVEHPSIRDNCFVLERFGLSISPISVEKDGRISPTTLARALEKKPDARFAAIMLVNNETGALMDMEALSSLISQHVSQREGRPLHLHSDLVQAVGKVPLDIKGWDLDSASISAHKLGGPTGIGLLYLRKPLEILFAGEQERGIRPGTENTMAALAMAKILEERASPDFVKNEFDKAEERMSFLIKSLKNMKRCSLIPKNREERDTGFSMVKRACLFSPWILQARFAGIPGEVLLRALDSEGFAISTGSACSSSSRERPVLAAMGLDESEQLEGVRISQGWTTSMDDIEALLGGIEKILGYL
jgi:cysteine desulfurase